MAKRYSIDYNLDEEINRIMKMWHNAGFIVSKPQVIRLLVEKYKNEGYKVPQRQRKSKTWQL